MKEPLQQNAHPLSADEVTLQATQQQRRASDPAASSWVGASAGSGKTKVLTDRVLRLLLPRENGEPATPPEKILALTFTKAAANEMALRLSHRLSVWTIQSDEELATDMEKNLLGRVPTTLEMSAARRLFAKTLDTPGGIKIMTIHAFCQSVLGRFPIEAGISPSFQALDEGGASELLQQSITKILSHAGTDPAAKIHNAIKNLSLQIQEDGLASLLQDALKERYQLRKTLERTFGVGGLYTALCAHLGVPAGRSEQQITQDACRTSVLPEADLRRISGVMQTSTSKTMIPGGAKMQAFLDAAEDMRPSLYEAYRTVFLTKEGGIRSSLVTKDVQGRAPDADDILRQEGERLIRFEALLKSARCTQITRDFLLLAEAVMEEYRFAKARQGMLDFDDMILTTLSLLKGELLKEQDVTPWVMFKMDGGLDHILVDEAQDTNPEQWEIIQILAREFFEGKAARDITRTLFVVGDEKQSIYGFQRAAPDKFGDMYKFFEQKIKESDQIFTPVDINTSFRSTQVILDAVDRTFIQAHAGKTLIHRYAPHRAQRAGQGGVAELWPILSTDKEEQKSQTDDAWHIPEKPQDLKSGSSKMATKIGDTIEQWLNTKEKLESYDRAIEPGDILVLVRSRNRFVEQLVRELKTRGIPVSGVDRMVLSDQLAVQDLYALAAFALLPEDDYSLACLLKSPFIGLNDDDLYTLCHNRAGPLWAALNASTAHAPICTWLHRFVNMGPAARPYEFFKDVLQSPCPAENLTGLHAMRVRLGDDTLDPLDELLNSALMYEVKHTGGLQSFLAWHMSDAAEIKRELEKASNAVRIMTIHGAKGLQAPIVFMPDTLRQKRAMTKPVMLWPHKTGFELPFVALSSGAIPSALTPARIHAEQKEEEESRRLLYVGMTRAEERLYVGGYYGKRPPSKETPAWYQDIQSGLLTHPAVIKTGGDDEGNNVTLSLNQPATAAPDKVRPESLSAAAQATAEEWMYAPAPEEEFPPRPLIPSRPSGEDEVIATSPLRTDGPAKFKRGLVTHKALELLPEIAVGQRSDILKNFLAKPAHALTTDIQASIHDEVMAILTDPAFASVFSAASKAEVPITGLIDGAHLVSGQIDRLVVTEKEVLIVDFKTNRPPPERAEDVPEAYKRQMALYKRTLSLIYPDKHVRTALIWTDGARLMEI
jgi:ATP-dependent helicase/nuclease subunit A